MKETRSIVCVNCGASLDSATEKDGVISCPYCGSTTQIPRLDSGDKTLSAIAEGENALRAGDFDKAMSYFDIASEESPEEAMAYWGKALARFKVQYIKDHTSGHYQPILFGSAERSFLNDRDYQKALKLANHFQALDYEKKAKEIEHVRLEFLRLEEEGRSYDTFICVKVSKEDGTETEDSKAADEIWRFLSNKGFHPFYSERDIRNRQGEDYEAMVLYALRKAKSMLLVCFDPAYLDTPWVKNEYSRYLKFIEDGDKEPTSLTIVYNDDPIDRLPGKSGRIQGINYALRSADLSIQDFVSNHLDKRGGHLKDRGEGSSSANEAARLIVRGEQEFERGDLKRAKEFFEEALEADPESFDAWYGSFFLLSDSIPSYGIKLNKGGATLRKCLEAGKKNQDIMATLESHEMKMAKRYANDKQRAIVEAFINSLKKNKKEVDLEMAAALLPRLDKAFKGNNDELIDELMAFIIAYDPSQYKVKFAYFYRTINYDGDIPEDVDEAVDKIEKAPLLSSYFYRLGNFPSLLENVPPEYAEASSKLAKAMEKGLKIEQEDAKQRKQVQEKCLASLNAEAAKIKKEADEVNSLLDEKRKKKERPHVGRIITYLITVLIVPAITFIIGGIADMLDPNAQGDNFVDAVMANIVPIVVVSIVAGAIATLIARSIFKSRDKKISEASHFDIDTFRLDLYGRTKNERRNAYQDLVSCMYVKIKDSKEELAHIAEGLERIASSGLN